MFINRNFKSCRDNRQSIYFNKKMKHIKFKDGGKIDFFDFLSIRPVLSIIDKKYHLSIKNRFCPELQKTNKFNSGQLLINLFFFFFRIMRILGNVEP